MTPRLSRLHRRQQVSSWNHPHPHTKFQYSWLGNLHSNELNDAWIVAESIHFNYHFHQRSKTLQSSFECGKKIYSISIKRWAFNKQFQSIHLDLVISGSLIWFMTVPQQTIWASPSEMIVSVIIDSQLERFWPSHHCDDHKSSACC